ncbi:iron-sulfur cluster carrier protein ApbC [Thiosulfativibrio zosterae]|uniref:Iron-sulfur cluster carrier protein n=1 Tax=Thiosulfativibrio zosterae TaxID=2675053 RepID=A0A6F8PMR9_9GAMM|nr:iron-sulfur cluster carrier protein ApbC [Thiosulfativibrio zosterae]BBP43337.1 iron-sulfur cluster carrier protein [Thiosulfativibrio zosterae]
MDAQITQLFSQLNDAYLGQPLSQFLQGDDQHLTLTLPYPAQGAEADLRAKIDQAWSNLGLKMPQIDFAYDIIANRTASKHHPIAGVKNIIAVSSAKGGVGKSTITANLALALQAEGARVGVLDADLYGPSQAKMFGIDNARPEINGKKMKPILAHDIQIATIANHLNREDTPLIWRGAQLNSALQTLLHDTEWDNLDYLVIDMPPGTGDVQLTISQQIPVAGAIIVSTPQEIALLDAKKGLKMFHQVNIPILGVIENMNMFICPKCGHEEHIFGHDGAQLMSLQYLVTFLGSLPLDKRIQEETDHGAPTVFKDPTAKVSLLFRDMARKAAASLILKAAELEAVVPQTEQDLMSGQIKEIKWNV